MKTNKPLKLSDILYECLSEPIKEGLESMNICKEWYNMIGPELSRYITDVTFSKGNLCMFVSSAVLKNELYMQRSLYIAKLNTRIGRNAVTSLSFK